MPKAFEAALTQVNRRWILHSPSLSSSSRVIVQRGGTGSGAILSIVSGMARRKQFFFEKRTKKLLSV
jgi:hypothetical protein